MNLELLKEILAVPTQSYREDQMVEWLEKYVSYSLPGCTVGKDMYNNVYITKGKADVFPCVAAHLDSVQPIRTISIVENEGYLRGYDETGKQVGMGADDKAGVFVCLELLKKMKNLKCTLFAGEEVGCVGSRCADKSFFSDIGFLMEFDCPGTGLMSFSCGGEQLFSREGAFIERALPVLKENNFLKWGDHPFTDVMIIRRRFEISCLNIGCGYRNWHASTESVNISETEKAIQTGEQILNALGNERYPFKRSEKIDPWGEGSPFPDTEKALFRF